MGFFLKSKPKRSDKPISLPDKQGFTAKIFSSSRKAVRRDRREVVNTDTKKRRHRLFGVVFLWILFVATAGYALFFSFFLTIENTHIEGANRVSSKAVEQIVTQELAGKHLKVWPRNNFFAVRPRQIEGLIARAYPLVRSVSVTRMFPNGLKVKLEERDTIVVWCSRERCDILNEEGVLVENPHIRDEMNTPYEVSVTDMSGQAVFPGQKIADSYLVTFITTTAPSLREQIGVAVNEQYTTTSRFADELRVKTKDGWELYLNTTIPIKTSLEALALLFEKELPTEKRGQLKYIDLRVENRAYYVLENHEETVVNTDTAAKPETTESKTTEKKKKK